MNQPLFAKSIPSTLPRYGNPCGIVFALQVNSQNKPLTYSYLRYNSNSTSGDPGELLTFTNRGNAAHKARWLAPEPWESLKNIGLDIIQFQNDEPIRLPYIRLMPGDLIIEDSYGNPLNILIASVSEILEQPQQTGYIHYWNSDGRNASMIIRTLDSFLVRQAKQDTIYYLKKK